MSIHYDPIDPPGLRGTLRELRLPLDAVRWAATWLTGPPQKRTVAAQPRTLMLLPGFGASPRSMWPMAAYLRGLGHQVHDWSLGRNTGQVPQLLPALLASVRALAQQAGQGVALVGWSLGGYLAREVAREVARDLGRDQAAAVSQVITLGSPVIGGPRFTAVAPWYRLRGHDLAGMERAVAQRFDTPLQVPVTAVYSKRDGIVAWQACIDHGSPQVQHVEVSQSHLGVGVAPVVLAIVGKALEQAKAG